MGQHDAICRDSPNLFSGPWMPHSGLSKQPDYRLEEACQARAPGPVAGIDEAGRGPLAGPVVAAAVILDPNDIPEGLDDSKRLSPRARARLATAITRRATVGIGAASVAEIERLNILRATLLAMERAVRGLRFPPRAALVDGNQAPSLACPTHTVVGGDGRSLSIAAASIMAKETRDRIMRALAERWPDYGFERHKGYPTLAHREALKRLGPTPHHRQGFAGVHKI